MNKLKHLNTFLVLIFCILLAESLFANPTGNQPSRQLTVVIDPGHGGKDPGAVNKSVREKDVVLGIGLKLGKLINENHPEVKVIFTRSTDVFIPLIDRSRIANKSKADLFISIHANFCATPSIKGTETFVLGLHRSEDNLEVAKKENSVILLEEDYSTTYEDFDPNSAESYIMFENVQYAYREQSVSLANNIQQQFKAQLETSNRGVKEAGFLVLRQSSMPSVLIETGFISNLSEANYLNSDEGQRHIALSIFEAFSKFKSKSSGVNNSRATEVIAKNQPSQETAVKQEVPAENQKKEVKKNEENVAKVIDLAIPDQGIAKKTSTAPEPEAIKKTVSVDTVKIAKTATEEYFSVQIGANTMPVEPSAANFKGLKNVRREKEDKYYRYFIGHEKNMDNITPILKQIKAKFPQAFIVSFVDGKRVPVNVVSK